MAPRSLKLAPKDHFYRRALLDLLGVALAARFENASHPDPADLRRAVDVLRMAVAVAVAADDVYAHSRASADLCHVLQTRFEHVGKPEDLDEAVDAGRTAVSLASQDEEDRASYLSDLAGALHDRFTCSGRDGDLEEAVAARRAALDLTPDDDPESATRFANLGVVLVDRFERFGQVADLEEAIVHMRARPPPCPRTTRCGRRCCPTSPTPCGRGMR